MGELVYQRKAHHVAVRGVLLSDVVSEGDESFGELGVLYGRAAKGRLGHAAIAAGLALTTTHCPSGTSEPDECSAVGIPIVAEAAFRPARVFGVGVQAFANLNRGRDFGGVVIFLQLGSMP